MILQRLCEYYDVIDADPEIEIAQEGFTPQKVTFEVVLSSDGSVVAINDLRSTEGKRKVPRSLRLPFEGRTSGVKAMFMWDKAEYLLGYLTPELRDPPDGESESDQKKRIKKADRVLKCFEASKETHLGFADSVEHNDYKALSEFYKTWQPRELSVNQLKIIDEVRTGFGVFRIDGEKRFMHDLREVRSLWAGRHSQNEPIESVACSVTGELGLAARLHLPIKGLFDQKKFGPLVSYNEPAFESFNRVKGGNAP